MRDPDSLSSLSATWIECVAASFRDDEKSGILHAASTFLSFGEGEVGETVQLFAVGFESTSVCSGIKTNNSETVCELSCAS